MTPEQRAAKIEIVTQHPIASCLGEVDEESLRERIAAAIREAVAAEREALIPRQSVSTMELFAQLRAMEAERAALFAENRRLTEAVAAAYEECAKIADKHTGVPVDPENPADSFDDPFNEGRDSAARDIAKAIRARSQA